MSPSAGEFDLGTARGRILITEDTRGLDRANKRIDDFERKTKSAGPKAAKFERGIKVLGTTAGIGLVAGFVASVKSAANFEKTISAIQAVSGATGKEVDKLRATALRIGKDTKFSASEAAQAMEELSKAGVSTTDILGGAADATVALAAAGEVALPKAAEIASNAMNVFNLSAREMPKVADLIAGAANASAIDVEEFGLSLQQAGAAAHLAGIPFDDLAVAIAEMGNAGIKGSDAGTSLKTMLLNLNPTTKKQKDLMRDLGIVTADGANQFFDATGKAKGLADIAAVLEKALKGQTQQQKLATLETLFGSDAIRAAAVITDNGAKGFNDLAASMGKISAADVAAKRMDNLAGDIEQLRGSVETLLITLGENMQPLLRGMVQLATRFVNSITEFHVPDALKNFSQDVLGKISKGFQTVVQGARNFGGDLAKAITQGFGGGGGGGANKGLQDQLKKAMGDPKAIHGIAATIGREAGAGMQEGVSKGPDWGAVGRTIANALLTALKAAGNFGSMLLDWIRSVNWLDVGKQAARAAVPFIIGFVNELVNALVDFAIHHPLDMALFVVALIPIGKFAGIIAKVLSKIPFLRAFAPLFEGLFKLTKPLQDAAGKLLSFIGKAFSEGFGRAFPGASRAVRGILDHIGLLFLEGVDIVRKAAVRVVGGFIEGIGHETGLAVRNVGQFIGFVTRPFRGAGAWLVRRGTELVRGLIRGVRSLVSAAVRTHLDLIRAVLRPFAPAGRFLLESGRRIVTGLISGARSLLGAVGRMAGDLKARIVNTFRGAGSFLLEAGKNIVRGLVNGGRQILKGIGNFLSDIKDAIVGGIKRLFGIKSPASVMVPLGANILRGVLKGMLTQTGNLRKVLGTIGGSITGFFKSMLGGNLPGIAVDLIKTLVSKGGSATKFLGNLLGGLGSKALSAFGDISGIFGKIFSGQSGVAGMEGFSNLGKQLAAALYGWTGAQWNALFNLGHGESGWRNTAQNPTSSAFGIGQFLDSTWALVGAVKTLDPTKQIVAMLKYIKLVYGDPIHAFGAWLHRVPHWYDQGGIWPSGTLGVNMSGHDEYVFNKRQWDELSKGRGDTVITLAPVLQFMGPTDGASVQKVVGKRSTWDALLQAARAKRVS